MYTPSSLSFSLGGGGGGGGRGVHMARASSAFSHAGVRLRVLRVSLEGLRKKRDCSWSTDRFIHLKPEKCTPSERSRTVDSFIPCEQYSERLKHAFGEL